METFEAIRTRRSTRIFTQDPVTEDSLGKIIAAGRFAPCGGNNQTTHLIIIRNRQILDELSVIVRDAFAKMEVQPDTYKSLKASINASKNGNYTFHYNAPVLIIAANKIAYGNAMADCACAIENMMLEANELDLGSCWINQLHWLDNNPEVRAYMSKLGLADDETICASMALGRAATNDNLPIRTERAITGNPLTLVD